MHELYHFVGGALTWGLQIVNTYGPLGLFFVISVEEAGVPLGVPGNMVIVYLGYQVSQSRADPIAILASIVAATTLGASLLYAIARRGGHPFLVRYGWRIRLNKKRLDQIESWLKRHGMGAVILARLIPSLRVPTNILSGVFDLPYRAFGPGISISAFLWGSGYLLIGYFLGSHFPFFESLIRQYRGGLVASVLVALAAIGIVALLEWRRDRWQRIGDWARSRFAHPDNETKIAVQERHEATLE